ncbi:uncharacterized protein LOC143183732 [Calliopsis andreniformis]|uniref:uncharacterized protein LOC143183732 n=1 Tax=Calliopsis andreniformis TaxID=337506 RepID=UPI003FCC2969
MRMPQIMVEAFAKGLIDKIMVEAFNVMDTNSEKLQMLENRGESADIQSQPTIMHNRSYIEPDEMELIEKMVHELRNLQIGDSTSVPSPLSNLETQVKQAVSNIGSVSIADPTKSPGLHIPQGQGDVHQILHDAVIETPIEVTCSRKEKEANDSNEATKISISLLHRLIEELETKAEESISEKEDKSTFIGKERIAAWEETEEQFIRTIESVDDPDQNLADTYDTASRNKIYDLTTKESSSVVHSTPSAKNVSLEEIAIEDITPLPYSTQDEVSVLEISSERDAKRSCNESKLESQKKKTVLGRMRKLLRTVFGRRKN